MRLHFLGATGTVTGSCFLLEAAGARVMVDCGMFQGPKEIRERNYGAFPVPPASVDFVLLTHAHIDHSGLIPKLVKHGFKGPVLATAPTVDLCGVLLPDSGHIQEMEVERKNRKNRRAGKPPLEPIYTADEASACLYRFKPVSYGEIVELNSNLAVRFVDAGHILGSASIEVWAKEGGSETKLVFSGDLGDKGRPIVNDPETIEKADYLVIESTYGDRVHDRSVSEIDLLHGVIWETYKKGGNLIIPAFAVERTQDLLYHLSLLMEAGKFPPMTLYIDSPMAAAASGIFRAHGEVFDRETRAMIERGREPIFIPGARFTQTAEESKSLNSVSRAIIISASGMCEAGRIRHHLKHNLWRPECTVLFVSYQPSGTLGRQLLDGEKTVRIFGEEVVVKADIRCIEGYSSHADREGLLSWVSNFHELPKLTFVVHGEPAASAGLALLLESRLGIKTVVPAWKQSFELAPAAGLRITENKLEEAFNSLLARLKEIQKTGTGPEEERELLVRLSDLAVFMDSILKKAG